MLGSAGEKARLSSVRLVNGSTKYANQGWADFIYQPDNQWVFV